MSLLLCSQSQIANYFSFLTDTFCFYISISLSFYAAPFFGLYYKKNQAHKNQIFTTLKLIIFISEFEKMTVEQKIDGQNDQFPVGMRVLAVDDDPTCLRVLDTLLRKCQYHGLFFHFFLIKWVLWFVCKFLLNGFSDLCIFVKDFLLGVNLYQCSLFLSLDLGVGFLDLCSSVWILFIICCLGVKKY